MISHPYFASSLKQCVLEFVSCLALKCFFLKYKPCDFSIKHLKRRWRPVNVRTLRHASVIAQHTGVRETYNTDYFSILHSFILNIFGFVIPIILHVNLAIYSLQTMFNNLSTVQKHCSCPGPCLFRILR